MYICFGFLIACKQKMLSLGFVIELPVIGRLCEQISVLESLSSPSLEPITVASIRDIILLKPSTSALQIG